MGHWHCDRHTKLTECGCVYPDDLSACPECGAKFTRHWLPTRSEIIAGCARAQAAWTPHDWKVRGAWAIEQCNMLGKIAATRRGNRRMEVI